VVVKDTTGAGDLFSSGFIHAYLQGKSLKECLLAGRDVAAQVVSVYGVDIPDCEWETLKNAHFKEKSSNFEDEPLRDT
jgi:sugar/nucleoside kinase (ribokinase family)